MTFDELSKQTYEFFRQRYSRQYSGVDTIKPDQILIFKESGLKFHSFTNENKEQILKVTIVFKFVGIEEIHLELKLSDSKEVVTSKLLQFVKTESPKLLELVNDQENKEKQAENNHININFDENLSDKEGLHKQVYIGEAKLVLMQYRDEPTLKTFEDPKLWIHYCLDVGIIELLAYRKQILNFFQKNNLIKK